MRLDDTCSLRMCDRVGLLARPAFRFLLIEGSGPFPDGMNGYLVDFAATEPTNAMLNAQMTQCLLAFFFISMPENDIGGNERTHGSYVCRSFSFFGFSLTKNRICSIFTKLHYDSMQWINYNVFNYLQTNDDYDIKKCLKIMRLRQQSRTAN